MESPRDYVQWFDQLESLGNPFWANGGNNRTEAVKVGIREILKDESESDLLQLQEVVIHALGWRSGSASRYGCSATGGCNSGLDIPIGIRKAIESILSERASQNPVSA